MPSPFELLDGLRAIANQWTSVAILWHVVAGVVLVAIASGWRPTKPVGAGLLSVPLLSVSLLAFFTANPFNGVVYLLFAVALGVVASRMEDEEVQPGRIWMQAFGLVLIAFGWVYPHFLEQAGWLTYLYAAPTGLLPCPTTAMVIGFGLLAGGFDSRAWTGILSTLGFLYGVFGVLRLGMILDFPLLIGASALLVGVFTKPQTTSESADSMRVEGVSG